MSRGLYPEADLLRALSRKVTGRVRRPRGGTGGKVYVKPGDTIGVIGDCWCGRPDNHDWVGKEDGAPHPRYPD